MSPRAELRGDIEGLRGVCVLLVVLFHAGVIELRNGFIGVDVFFVLSGFLITGQLLRDQGAGRLCLTTFWARRVRRLLPSATVVIVGTVAMFALFASPLQWRPLAREAFAATGYVSNVLYAMRAADYFAEGIELRPLLHFWSLAIEEQFYFVWPLLFWATAGRPARRRIVTAVIGVVTLGSLMASAVFSADHSWAFFLLPTRAWELGVGAGLAVGTGRLARLSVAARELLAAAGALLLLGGVVAIPPGEPYPGVAALLPALSAVATIAAGVSGNPTVSRIYDNGFMRSIGRISYVWYLWHWPALRLAEGVAPGNVAVVAIAIVLSLVAAAVTHVFVEQPLRNALWLRANRAAFLFGAASMALAFAAAGSLYVAGRSREKSPDIESLMHARRDFVTVPSTCHRRADAANAECVGGADAGPVVVVVGDSHAAQWIPPLVTLGERRGFRVVYTGLAACPAAMVGLARVKNREHRYIACDEWHASVASTVASLQPALIVIASYDGYIDDRSLRSPSGDILERDDALASWESGTRAAGSALAGVATVLWLDDVPPLPFDPLDCIAQRSFNACAVSVDAARASAADVRAAGARGRAGQRSLDPAPLLFPDGQVRMDAPDGVIAYRDKHHVTLSRAKQMAGALERALDDVLPGPTHGD